MRYHAYYLVEPNKALLERLKGQPDPAFAEILSQAALLENREGGRSAWGTLEHEARMKVLWVARLREYTALAKDCDAETWLGSAAVSVASFDRWWSIRRFELEDTDASLEQLVKPVAEKLESTGSALVDAWQKQLVDP